MPLNQPKISIIIPLYNKEQYIGRCIESIQNQSYQDFEIILVDDCSSDNSIKIIEKKAEFDNRIKYIPHEKNLGTMKARETGYKNAMGEYIVFVDSDDFLPDNALETLYTEISQSDIDIIKAGFQYVGENTVLKNKIECPLVTGEFSPIEIFHYLLKGKIKHNVCSCIFNANLFKYEYHCFDNLTYGEDLILFYELVGNSKKIKTIEAVTYNYYFEGLSATRSPVSAHRFNQLILVHSFRYRFLKERKILIKENIRNLANNFVNWNRYKVFQQMDYKLDEDIAKKLKFPTILKYLSLKGLIKYFLYKVRLRTI